MKKYQKEYIKFLKEFNKFKKECNKKAVITGEKFYLSVKIIDKEAVVYINSTNTKVNEFVILGYFYNVRDCQQAREKYKKNILKFYKYSYKHSLGELND